MKFSGTWILIENFWSIIGVILTIIIFIILWDKYQTKNESIDTSIEKHRTNSNWLPKIDLISFRINIIILVLILVLYFLLY